MRIDLHTHSTASDGTQSPAQVVVLAAAAHIDVLALTDHDSAAGWEEAATAAAAAGVTLIPGMEISTKHAGAGVHVLAYLPDPSFEPLARELQRILAGREGRLSSMLTRLQAAGVDITEGEVMDRVGRAPAIGRPHIADVMVAKGLVRDRAEAFSRWLGWGRPGYVERYAPATGAMIDLVTRAGGAALIAHPWGRGSRRVLHRETVGALVDAGLVGLEVDHQDHAGADREALRSLATDLDLVITGSSDFHGDGKVDHELGCNLTSPAHLERLLSAAADNATRSGRLTPAVVRP